MRKVYNKMRNEKGKMRNCFSVEHHLCFLLSKGFLLSAFSFLLFAFVACENDESLQPMPTTSDYVEVVASIGDKEQTRVSQTSDNVYTFDHNDKIHIVGWHGDWDQYNKPWEMASNTWWNDAVSTYNATSDKWNTEPYMRWQNGDGLNHHFIAWWPENIIKSNENLTAVNITVTGDYNKDDILVARWSGKHPEDNVLNLEFKHLLSRFDVHLHFRGEYPNPENISIETHLRKTARCDFLTGEVTTTSGEGVRMQKRPYPDTNWDWNGTCITVPHDFRGNEQLLIIRFTANGVDKAISYTHSQDLIFHTNERITLMLEVGKDKVELIDVTVTPWESKNINAGEAEEEI